MAKYGNPKLGLYDQLWSSSDKKYLQSFFDNAALLQVKYKFAYKHFQKASMSIPTGQSGEATFHIVAANTTPDEMADFRAPLSNTSQLDRPGLVDYYGSIPEIGKGFKETASERYQKERIVAEFGNDAVETQLIQKYLVDLQTLRNTVDSRLSNMAAQVMTTGKIVGHNADNENLEWYRLNVPVPAENFVNAGAKVWTDATADLLAQMQQIENDFRDRTSYDGAMKWNITINMWRNVFLKNKQLRDAVLNYRTLAEKPVAANASLTEAWLNDYFNAMGVISPIEIIEEGEALAGINTRKSVVGWDDSIAVLRPVGYAGEFMYTGSLDAVFAQKYKSPVVDRLVASLEGGMMTLINTTNDNGGYPEWHTDLFCAAVPTLNEWPYHVVVNTAKAG